MKAIILVVYMVLAISEAFAGDCKEKIGSFLNRPTQKNHSIFIVPNPIDNDNCWRELQKNVHNLARLYAHTKNGNPWAVRVLIKHTEDLDGGELEDAYIALGESIDRDPQLLLREFKAQRLTENQFQQALVMLSLSYTDNEKKELLALKARKKKILSVKDNMLKQQKDFAVKIISDEISRSSEATQHPDNQ